MWVLQAHHPNGRRKASAFRSLLDRTPSPSPLNPIISQNKYNPNLKIKNVYFDDYNPLPPPPSSPYILHHRKQRPSPHRALSRSHNVQILTFTSQNPLHPFSIIIQLTKELPDTLGIGKREGPTRNRTGVARKVQTRSWKSEGSEPKVITATL